MFKLGKRQKGMGMIELMVALVITLLLGLAVGGVFVVTKRGFADAEDFARIQDNGRYALLKIVEDLRMISFWGDATFADVYAHPDLPDVTNDCSGAAEALDLEFSIFAVRLGGSDTGAFTCIDDAAPSSDILVARHVTGGTIDAGSLSASKTYLMTNLVSATLFPGTATPPTTTEGGDIPDGRIWTYEIFVYYVRRNPSDSSDLRLYRKHLVNTGTGWNMVGEEVAAGVESVRFLFGVDSDGDGEVDQYVDADALATAADWETVLTVQVYLLVRGTEDKNHSDNRTYTLGNVSAGPFNDNYHRSVMTATVNLRNPLLLTRGDF